ncbi:alpha/beta fold hydrolase [Pseudomonas sp. sp1636]|uniref:alpha/beta hydrolase family protein n=1 Tax=Pseudomonas sp. sp1636 TaxID=3036707 RepID=UPI0025A593F5|nr:alpha/beta fold hydrolase [Pseudomonas sp. sp1636]MDM8350821.1 alpha/beta fold hydrolase [Pseudomonas sp. sp1636]
MTSDSQTILGETVQLPALDGYPLIATRYHAPAPVAQLLIAGATGVPQGFYRRFAEYAARRGFSTLTLDYRGIGLSKPASLRGFEMDYLDWAHLDLAAAVDQHRHAERPLFMVGHSFGGHAFGLLPNHAQVQGFYTFGTGAGWHGWMPRAEQLRVLAMWRVIGPLITRAKGYLAWSTLNMGEDLPLGVYTQWKHWCRFPRYFFEDPQLPGLAERFAQVNTPIVAANALDDLWAPPQSRDAFMAAYTGAPYQARDIDTTTGLGAIGHMGYFRPAAQPLWDETLDWFSRLPNTRQAA